MGALRKERRGREGAVVPTGFFQNLKAENAFVSLDAEEELFGCSQKDFS